ncbi:MAG TPA: CHASE sensor domain-containing protein, partial [Terriglobales bacterium]|nr:CHASE sensor domain-containing protein [Terriglobales bacterium]
MRSFRDVSIGSKLTFLIMGISSTALLLACLAVGAYDLLDLRRTMANDLAIIGGIVSSNSTAALAFHDPQAASDVLAALHSEPHVQVACVLTPDGKIFARYTRLHGKSAACPPPKPDGTYSTA